MTERLNHIKGKVSSGRISVYYAWYDPKTVYKYDTEDALEDFLWMIAEIERLRVEVNDLQSPRSSDLKGKLPRESAAENAGASGDPKKQRGRKTKP